MSDDFAKLFSTERGQVVVMKDQNDEADPCVRIYFSPEGLGTCAVTLSFSDNDAGYEKRDKFFGATDAQRVTEMLEPYYKQWDTAGG
jgi:hypothetical protein